MRAWIVSAVGLAVVVGAGAGCQIDEGPDRGPVSVGAGAPSGGSGGASADGADGGSSGESADAGAAGGASATGGATAINADGGGSGGAPAVVPVDGGGSSAPSVCDGAGTRALGGGKVKIDNFEGGALDLGWSTFSDVPMAMNAAKMTIQSGGAAGTAHAGHYFGSGALPAAKGGFGVGAVFNPGVDRVHGIYCVDISSFDGVSFWAKAGSSSSASDSHQLRVNFVLPETNAVSVGGDCPDASGTCYNHPRKTVTLNGEWNQYVVSFAEATGGSASVRNRIQGLAFLSPDADWNYVIDEIQFYKGTPPSGPTPP